MESCSPWAPCPQAAQTATHWGSSLPRIPEAFETTPGSAALTSIWESRKRFVCLFAYIVQISTVARAGLRAQPRVAGPGRAPCPRGPRGPRSASSPTLAAQLVPTSPNSSGRREASGTAATAPGPPQATPRAIAAPASLRPVRRWVRSLCRAAGAARPAPS